MNIRDLTYLVTAADLGHFGKAAEQCCVSQPSLSNQIKKLEEELGITLFERSNRRVMLTEAGKQIAEIARGILRDVGTMRELAATHHDPLSGNFRLGAFPTLSTYLFPQLVTRVKAAMPHLRLILVEEKTSTLIDQLKHGALDAALLALPVAEEGFASAALFNDPFYLAVPPKHPLATKRTVDQSELAKEKLLLLEEGHCLRDQALDVCQLHGIGEEQDFKATGLETLRQMVKAGTGITFIPRIAIDENDDAIRYIPFSNPAPTRQIGLFWRKNAVKTICCDKFVDLIRQFDFVR